MEYITEVFANMRVKKANYQCHQPCLCFTFSLLVCRFKGGSFSLVSSKNSFRLAFQAFKPSFSDLVFFVLRDEFAKRPVKSRSLKQFLSGVFSPLGSPVVARFSLLLLSKAAPKTTSMCGYFHHCFARCDSSLRLH